MPEAEINVPSNRTASGSSRRAAKPEVDKQIFRDGLSCLGKTFNNARHAYLKLRIDECNLEYLNGIQKFKYLIDIDVSKNNLTTLEPLSAIKHFIKLNARDN